MVILIDGYNLLRHIFPKVKGSLDLQRKQIIEQLSYYKTEKQAEIQNIIIVFDAGPFLHATRETKNGIVVMFSGQKKSADEWNIDYVSNHHHNQDILLVTRDRKLIEECEQFNIQSIDIAEFYSLMKQVLFQPIHQQNKDLHQSSVIQYQDIENEDIPSSTMHHKALAFLMEQATLNIPTKDESKNIDKQAPKKKGNSLTFSKKEKKIYAKLKKLS